MDAPEAIFRIEGMVAEVGVGVSTSSRALSSWEPSMKVSAEALLSKVAVVFAVEVVMFDEAVPLRGCMVTEDTVPLLLRLGFVVRRAS